MHFCPGLLALFVFVAGVASWTGPKGDLKWWQTGIIYQVYPRSFKDSDGDGVGDIPGITSKLQYLKDLGIKGVWLSPIYPSPLVDFGYDIANFEDVDPIYGTLADFDKLVEEAHKLDLKVLMDLVPNHTSDQHAWFVASEDPNHPEHEKYRDYYMWHDGKIDESGERTVPNNWLSVFRGTAWTWNEKRNQYYFHQFHKKQPDLDFRNPDVKEDFKKALQFWLDRNVDGFRVDAAPFLFEDPEYRDEPRAPWTDDKDDHAYLNHIYTQDFDETYELFAEWMELVDPKNEREKVMLSEGYVSLENTMRYYGPKERPVSTFPFNFFMLTDLDQSSNSARFAEIISRWMNEMTEERWPNWVIGNHDRSRVASRYGPELADALNMLSLTLPGTAMTYNGEELGMTDTFVRWEDTLDPQGRNAGQWNYQAKSRDPFRTPFQWDDTVAAGFSSNPKTWLPLNPNYWQLNVAKQMCERSHFTIYRQMTEARKLPALQRGDLKLSHQDELLIVERILANEDPFMLVINFGTQEATFTHENLSKMHVYASSLNSGVEDGQKLEILHMKPKSAFLMSTAPVTYTPPAKGIKGRLGRLLSSVMPAACSVM